MIYRKANINGKLYDVLTSKEYFEQGELYDYKTTAILDNGFLYPLRKKNRLGSGCGAFMITKDVLKLVDPTEEEKEIYRAKEVIDLTSTSSMVEMIEKQSKFRNMERQILCDVDNIYKPVITESDTPHARALKEAIIAKRIDINKYKHRIPTICNDKRTFAQPNITMYKLLSTAKALDIDVQLILKDKSPDVPNPMGKEIVVDLITCDEDDMNNM